MIAIGKFGICSLGGEDMRNKCVYCKSFVKWNERSYICDECFDKKLKIKIRDPDRVVENPHNSWF